MPVITSCRKRNKKEIGWVMERTQDRINYNRARIREYASLIRQEKAELKKLEQERDMAIS